MTTPEGPSLDDFSVDDAFQYLTSKGLISLTTIKQRAHDLLKLQPADETNNSDAWQAWYNTVRVVFPHISNGIPDVHLTKMVEEVEEYGLYLGSISKPENLIDTQRPSLE